MLGRWWDEEVIGCFDVWMVVVVNYYEWAQGNQLESEEGIGTIVSITIPEI